MKVLKICQSWPWKEKPGMGLTCYFHTLYSKNKNMVITAQRDEVRFLPNDTEIVQIPYHLVGLGDFKENFISRTLKFTRKLFGELKFCIRSIPYIKKFNPDVIHIYGPISIMCGLYSKYILKKKLIMSLHGTDVQRMRKNIFYRSLLYFPDKVISVDKATINLLSKAPTKQPISSIENGVDLSFFSNLHEHRKHQFVQVANLRWQKGQQYLLEAFSLLHLEYPNFELVIIGEGPERDTLSNLCDQLGIQTVVRMVGYQDREYILKTLNESYGFVLSSVIEGFPKVVIEAMATGTPVVSTNVGSLSDIIKNCGFISPAEDPASLYESMKSLIECTNWQELSEMAQNTSQQYSWEIISDRLDNIYLSTFNGLAE